MGEQAYTHCKPRLDDTISNRDKSGITKAANWQGGGGYHFYELAPTLINEDAFGEAIINPGYDADMLAAAVALHEGFTYQPDLVLFWKQAAGNENSYLFTTTRHLTADYMDAIKSSMEEGEYLVIACRSFDKGLDKVYGNITVKKIPQMLLDRCEFGRTDYNLNIVHPPRYEDEEEYPPQRRSRYEDEEPVRRRGTIWPIFLAVAAVLLFVGMVVYFLWNTLFAGFFAPPQTHPVPNLVGRVYEEIKSDTELLAGFILVEGDTVTNDADPGTIIDQDPKGDKEVGENVTEIKVTISGGPEIIPMPDLSGMTYTDAAPYLRSLGLRPAVPTYENHDTIEEGFVISYTPMKDVELPPGTEVQIVVSKGPADEPFPMPELVGKTQALAESIITTSNLKRGRVDPQYDDTVEEGKVVSQYPLADAQVTEGTEVNLVISLGPDPSTQPPVIDPPVTNPTGTTKTVEVPLHGFEGSVTVRLLMDGAEVGYKIADANMDTVVSFNVTGTGTKVLSYFINGEAVGTITVNFDE